jgi:phosphoribosylformylglycinamidine synthase
MLWEVEIRPLALDAERQRVLEEYTLFSPESDEDALRGTSRGYLLEGDLGAGHCNRLANELLLDPLLERSRITAVGPEGPDDGGFPVTVLLKPGVMDPAALSVVDAARDLGVPLASVRTFRRYYFRHWPPADEAKRLWRKALLNEAIEQAVEGPLRLGHLTLGSPYVFELVRVPLRERGDRDLEELSRAGQLSLSLAEMRAIQAHFRALGRDPTDVELETLAQTWSEHCSHKTLKGRVDFEGRRYENLLRETIFAATQEIRRRLGPDDWCVSVFEDNAGVVRFDERYHACFKVETHNHPSAIEPYGGANTGLGGVIRDPLGTGLGAKPVCNTDVFCFAPPDGAAELPPGVLHTRKVIRGVVAGVRDYGNRMGIPTVSGAVCFDERYLANPLVFCGTVGLIPVDRAVKQPRPGDLVVVVGGRTGRDGIHGATFSSARLSAESEAVSGGAVQIGNAITEKKLLDVLLQARDRGLYHAITDCGAGGFSSAVGEMAETLGAEVHLDRAPQKYEGLSYTEIWISESQERMILAVPPEWWPALQDLCVSEDVEAAEIGRFEPTGRLRLFYDGRPVADLDLHFLHRGRPPVVRQATCPPAPVTGPAAGYVGQSGTDRTADLLRILSSFNVCSKEWIIRQYDHEVQGGSVLKPLVGRDDDGPGDAAVIAPVLGSPVGLAVGCGINPCYGDLDPYAMAAAAVDEAVRNVVAVGADPARVALVDNFCWGDTDRPEVLGSLVRAAQACHDAALALGTPFISGKDSLHNEYRSGGHHRAIPPTLLVSALGRVPDVRRCVSMDFKEPGNRVFLLGVTRDELGGSHYHLIHGVSGGTPPQVDLACAVRLFGRLHEAIRRGLVRACHDLSEGGLAVAVAEMAFAGGVGADLTELEGVAPGLPDHVRLFSESATRFAVEVRPAAVDVFLECLSGQPLQAIGQTSPEQRLRIAGAGGGWVVEASLAELKEAWQKPLRW